MRSARALVEEAMALVTTLDTAQALAMLGQPEVVFVDIREPGEREREGSIPAAFNAPRGLLEFWFDATAGTGKSALTRPDAHYVLFCAAGWRSALAARTLQDMGVRQVAHLGGGFDAWKAAGAPTTGGAPVATHSPAAAGTS